VVTGEKPVGAYWLSRSARPLQSIHQSRFCCVPIAGSSLGETRFAYSSASSVLILNLAQVYDDSARLSSPQKKLVKLSQLFWANPRLFSQNCLRRTNRFGVFWGWPAFLSNAGLPRKIAVLRI
jgi:hypothetical protein